jgi:hypothetical protein
MARILFHLRADANAFCEALREALLLYGDGTGVPARTEARLRALGTPEGAKGERLIRLERMEGGVAVFVPGHKLLAVLASLRAARGDKPW